MNRIQLVKKVSEKTVIGAIVLSAILLLIKLFGWLHISFLTVFSPLWLLAAVIVGLTLLSLLGMAFISTLIWFFNKS